MAGRGAEDDVLLGEIIVRAGALSGEAVARALAEVSRRRAAGQEVDLARVLAQSKLLDRLSLEDFRRRADAEKKTPSETELSRTLRLAYDSGSTEVQVPLPQRRASGRYEVPPPPPAGPVPVLPQAPPSVTSSAASKMLGRTWGSYEILTEVARGAMGAIYRARDKRRGGQEVALKVLLQGSQADPEDLERFKREARALQKLNHPAIVRFYEYGVFENCPFVSMDFVAGTTLESIIQGGGISIDKGLVILEQVARAVDHAHSKGVVHRDLKPANVLIGNDNLARVTDFGLARILEDNARLTRTGDLIGTPLYMSPEAIRGDLMALGPSSDVWSLGVTLYLLLTGEQPFGAKTIEDVAKRVKNDEPAPPRRLRPATPEDLEKICLTALAKDPKLRYQSAGELANDLRAYLHGKPVLAGRVTLGMRLRRFYRSLKLRPLRVLLASALVLLLPAGLVVAQVAHGRSEPPTSTSALSDLEANVNALPQGKLAPGDAERELEAAFLRVQSGHPGTIARARALRAMGHRALAKRPPAGGSDEAAWAARQLLLAASLAPRPSVLSLDGRVLLEEALEPLARVLDPRPLEPLVRSAVETVGAREAPLPCARALALAGLHEEAAGVLSPALPSLAGSEREAARDLLVECLLAQGESEKARALVTGETPRERLQAARALRALPVTEERSRERARLLEGLDAAPGSELAFSLELERAALQLDRGRPRAALEHLARAGARKDPRALVLHAGALVLEGDPGAIATDELAKLDAVIERTSLPSSLRASAALARSELAILSGADVPALPALPGARVARRLAFARAAPDVAAAVTEVARELWAAPAPKLAAPPAGSPRGGAPRGGPGAEPPKAEAEAEAALAELVAADDLEAASWLSFAKMAERKGALDQERCVKLVFEKGERSKVSAAALAALVHLVTSGGLERNLWPDGKTPSEAPLRDYMTLDAAVPAVLRLVSVASDRIAIARARIPLDWKHAPLGGADEKAALDDLSRAERILAVALRRDPFAAPVRRARARLALATAEVAFASGRAERELLLPEAAATVLLAPYDRASLLAIAHACVAAGRLEDARRWAERASVAGRGDPGDGELVLMAALGGSPPAAVQEPIEASRRALAFAVGGLAEDAIQARFEEAKAMRPPAPDAALDPRACALAALAWDGSAVDRAFRAAEDANDAPTDDASLLLALARDAHASLAANAAPADEALARSERLLAGRSETLAPRVYRDLILVSLGSPDDAATALDDVESALEVSRARHGAADCRLAAFVQVLARERLRLASGSPGSPDADRKGIERPPLDLDVSAVLDRWRRQSAR